MRIADFVAAGCHTPLRLKDEVRAEVRRFTSGREAGKAAALAAGAFGERAVHLHPERIHAEDKRLPSVVVSAQEHDDVVV